MSRGGRSPEPPTPRRLFLSLPLDPNATAILTGSCTLAGVDLSALILHDGSQARATGRVVAYRGDVWFEPPMPVRLVAHAPGHEPPPRPSGVGVRTSGVDLDRLSSRFEKDGAVAGWATLSGIWRGERLDVIEQSEESRDENPWRPFWRTPPCPPPPGGWPQVPEGSNIEPSPPSSIPGRVSVVVFRPTPTQVVLVVATSQPEAAEALLRPVYGDALCVVASRWSPDQVEAVRQALHRHWAEWGVYEFGGRAGDDAQVTVAAKVVRVLPGIAEWSLTVPPGIVEVTPWLGPVDPRPPDANGSRAASAARHRHHRGRVSTSWISSPSTPTSDHPEPDLP